MRTVGIQLCSASSWQRSEPVVPLDDRWILISVHSLSAYESLMHAWKHSTWSRGMEEKIRHQLNRMFKPFRICKYFIGKLDPTEDLLPISWLPSGFLYSFTVLLTSRKTSTGCTRSTSLTKIGHLVYRVIDAIRQRHDPYRRPGRRELLIRRLQLWFVQHPDPYSEHVTSFCSTDRSVFTIFGRVIPPTAI